MTVNGTLDVGAGTTLSVDDYSLTVSGTTSVSGTLSQISSTFAKTYAGLVTINATGRWSNGTAPINFQGGLIHNGVSFTSGSGTYLFDSHNQLIGGTSLITISRLTVTGINLTNTGTLTVNTDMNGSGALIQGSGATLKIGGTSSLALTATASSNTVNYSGTAQTIPGMTYYHLSTSGSGIKTIDGNITIAGDLNVGTGTTLTVQGFSITVSGATMVDGILIHNDPAGTKTYVGLVTIDGSWNNTGNASFHFRGGLLHNGSTFTAGTGMYTFETNDQNIGGLSALSIPNVTVTAVTLTNTNSSVSGLSLTTLVSGTGTLAQATNTSPQPGRVGLPYPGGHGGPEHGQL